MHIWINEKIIFLQKNYKILSYKQISNILNINVNTIIYKAKQLGMHKVKHNEWTEKEIEYLRKNFNNNDYSICCEHLNRTKKSVYGKAKNLKLFSLIRNKWTKERCISLAKKYKFINIFKDKCYYGWKVAKKNNWLDEICLYLKEPNSNYQKWTKEKAKKICDNYIYYEDFRKKERKLYDVIIRNKWLDELCSHMIRKINKHNYWTLEKCLTEALKYNTRYEWFKLDLKSYTAAQKHNWLNECCKHMEIVGNNSKRAIYAFEFEDNSVYVGLSFSPNERKKSHLNTKTSTVYIHIQETNLIPKFKILTEFLEKTIASKKEIEFVEKYKKENWIVLNKVKAGCLGGRTKVFWTYERCLEVAKECKFRSEFRERFSGAHHNAVKNNWYDECCKHMEYKQLPNSYWNDKNRCIEAANKCKTKSEFKKRFSRAYVLSIKNNWIEDCVKNMCN